MSPQRWRRIEEVFQGATERKSEDRGAYLEEACGGDGELRREVESLLERQSAGALLDQPALRAAADLLDTGAVDQATQLAGRRISHYEILEKLGEGGMGVVYKARDARLNRFVAIKVLPPERVADPERKRRLALEARAASALNHPNIVTVYDIERVANVDFIAMEYVEGKTLDEAIGRKGLKLNEALKYAIQIADAVAKAHAAGIVHRDLKPGNVMVTADGRVKILDFGLAKLTEPDVQPEGETRTERQSTELGAIMGTAGYMSPEQAAGRKVEARSDIFSFGSVLYEMLTGRRAFRKETPALTLAAIQHTDPPPLGPEIPHEVEKVVMHCLRKDPARRYQYMADVKVALEDLKEESESGALGGAAVIERKSRRWWLWIAAATATLLLAVTLAWWLREAAPSELQPVALTAYAGIETQASFSPDGRKLAFVWNGDMQDNFDIYVKQIDSAGTPMRLTTSPGAERSPAWSPDDRWIAFVRAPALVLIPPLGGPERNLIEMMGISRLSWTPDAKWILFNGRESLNDPSSIWAVSIETNERRRLTRFVTTSAVAAGRGAESNPSLGDYGPSISPHGSDLAFARQVGSFVYELRLMRVTGDMRPDSEPRLVTNERYGDVSGIAWTADGRDLVYSAGGTQAQYLWRAPASGQRPPIRVAYALPAATFPAIAGARGILAYTWWVSNRNLWRLDTRTGERRMLISSTYEGRLPQFSPNGRRIAFNSNRSGNVEVWTCDAEGANCVQVTFFGGPQGGTPAWSPDGRWLALDSRLPGHPEIYVVAADGGAPRRVTDYPANNMLPSWSHDGRWIYFASDRTGRYELWKMPKDGGQAFQVTRSGGYRSFESPDGKFVYYVKADLPGVFRTPTEGGEEAQVLPDRVTFGSWGVTTKGVYFIPEDSRTVEFLETATGRKRTVAAFDKPGSQLTVCPDDSCVVWGQTDRNTQDLMLVERFR